MFRGGLKIGELRGISIVLVTVLVRNSHWFTCLSFKPISTPNIDHSSASARVDVLPVCSWFCFGLCLHRLAMAQLDRQCIPWYSDFRTNVKPTSIKLNNQVAFWPPVTRLNSKLLTFM